MPPPPTKENVLDLDVRRDIVAYVTEHPGVHMRAIAEALGMAVSTVEYHCHQLTRHDCITSRDDGGLKVYFPAMGLDRRDKDVLYVVRHDSPRRICTELILEPGMTPKDLKARVGISGATLSFHLNRLRNAGILEEEPAGRTKKLSVTDPERIANVLVTFRQSFVDEAVDQFAETWLMMNPPAEPEEPEAEDGATESDRSEREGENGAAESSTERGAQVAMEPVDGEPDAEPDGPPEDDAEAEDQAADAPNDRGT